MLRLNVQQTLIGEKVPSVLARLCLFISSYFPLACIVVLLFWSTQRILCGVVIALATIALTGMILFMHYAGSLAPSSVQVHRVQRIDAEATSYIVTYVIPFLALPSDSWQHGLALIVLYAVLGVLYVTADLIHINPMLNLMGYHLYEVGLTDGGEYALITRKRIRRGERLRVCPIGDGILLSRGSEVQA